MWYFKLQIFILPLLQLCKILQSTELVSFSVQPESFLAQGSKSLEKEDIQTFHMQTMAVLSLITFSGSTLV